MRGGQEASVTEQGHNPAYRGGFALGLRIIWSQGKPHRVSTSQALLLEGRDLPFRAELESPVMEEGISPDHSASPPLPAR